MHWLILEVMPHLLTCKFALKANCCLFSIAPKNITVAGDGQIICDSCISDCNFYVGKHEFCHTFRVLNLPNQDIILRCDWLSLYSPISVDFIGNKLLLQTTGTTPISIDICTPAEKIEFIEAHELDKWLDQGISGMILQLAALNMDSFTSTPPEIQRFWICSKTFSSNSLASAYYT